MKRVPITLPCVENGAKLRPMIGAVIYVRVSDPRQAENLSLATQLKACEDYCERQGFVILERFSEQGESAKTADRTELQRLLQYCRTHKGKVHFVVVFNLTRFAREKYDHFALRAHLKSLGISLRSATEPIDDTATGKLMEGVLAAFAQFDNDVRSDRTKAGMRAALELGRWTFLAPLGSGTRPNRSRSVQVVSDQHAYEAGNCARPRSGLAQRQTRATQLASDRCDTRNPASGSAWRFGRSISPTAGDGEQIRRPIRISDTARI